MTEKPSPVTYAEVTLEVHEVFRKTAEARDSLDRTLTDLSEKRDGKRHIEQHVADREMELAIEERGKHPEMSATAMEKHLKQVTNQDEEWRKLRDELRETNDAIDGLDADRKIHERDIEIGCARMTQLGGYLNYLAAAKNAATVARTT